MNRTFGFEGISTRSRLDSRVEPAGPGTGVPRGACYDDQFIVKKARIATKPHEFWLSAQHLVLDGIP